jgi:hypothetical protein
MKILIAMDDFNEIEFRFKDVKYELLTSLNQISKIDSVRLFVIDKKKDSLRKLNIADDLSYSIDPE